MEKVLVVPADTVSKHLPQEGCFPLGEEELRSVLEGSRFIPRANAEGNPAFRQIIPYIVVRDGSGRVLTVERLLAQSESRLHNKYSIGIGGHINPEDGFPGLKVLWAAARRELSEELIITEGTVVAPLRYLGVINDLSTPVSRDHLGCLLVLDTDATVAIREKSKMRGAFLSLSEILENKLTLESWSSLVLPYLGVISPTAEQQ